MGHKELPLSSMDTKAISVSLPTPSSRPSTVPGTWSCWINIWWMSKWSLSLHWGCGGNMGTWTCLAEPRSISRSSYPKPYPHPSYALGFCLVWFLVHWIWGSQRTLQSLPWPFFLFQAHSSLSVMGKSPTLWASVLLYVKWGNSWDLPNLPLKVVMILKMSSCEWTWQVESLCHSPYRETKSCCCLGLMATPCVSELKCAP